MSFLKEMFTFDGVNLCEENKKNVLLHLKLNDMARIMAIDLGRKRSGIAVTDPLQIIANGLTTVESHKLVDFVLNYVQQEEVERIVIGEPKDMKNNPSDCSKYIEPIVNRLKKVLPNIPIVRYDERFTSVMAHQTMIDAGLSKSKRQDKELVDTIAATIILQSFLESKTRTDAINRVSTTNNDRQ